MFNKKVSYKGLIDFSNALDSHMLTTQCFFDSEFLNLIDKHLGYNTCSFIVYESNTTYKSSTGHNVQLAEDYENNYLNIDPLANYISTNYHTLISQGNKVIKSSDVFPNYDESNYHQTLKAFSDVDFAAVIPFNNLRLTVYKSCAEGDFTEEEISLLSILSDIITSRYTLYSKTSKPSFIHTLEDLKNIYFDSISTGVIILDKSFNLLDSNNIGREYVNSLSPAMSISSYFKSLIPLLNFAPVSNGSSHMDKTVKLGDFMIEIKLYYDNETIESLDNKDVFFITITNNETSTNNNEASRNLTELHAAFREKYSLSSREMDIIIALANGQKYQNIADNLFISINTVRTHVKNIYRKLEINNQRSLLYKYNQYLLGEQN